MVGDDLEDLLLFLLKSVPDGLEIEQRVPSVHFLQQLQWLLVGLGGREHVFFEVSAQSEGFRFQHVQEDLLRLVPTPSEHRVGRQRNSVCK